MRQVALDQRVAELPLPLRDLEAVPLELFVGREYGAQVLAHSDQSRELTLEGLDLARLGCPQKNRIHDLCSDGSQTEEFAQ